MEAKNKKIAFLFPGQGSQVIGMGRDLERKYPPGKAIFEQACDITGKDIRKLSFRGPMKALAITSVLQPAITAVNLSCNHWLHSKGIIPDAVAGHSLGEFSALACAGTLTAEDTIRLTTARGKAMDDASKLRPGAMIAAVGLPAKQVVEEIEKLLPRSEGGIANLNASDQVVLSGTPEGIELIASHLKILGARTVPLKVSGAWHSELMLPAEKTFAKFLETVKLGAPSIPVFLNATGLQETKPQAIKTAMIKQLRSPVQWMTIIEELFKTGINCFVEVGPGKVLRGLLRRIIPDPRSYEVYLAGDLRALERVAKEVL